MTKRLVIIGGGFGGLHLVRQLETRLRRGEAEVTLVDRNNFSLFTPLLYQVATGELPPHAVAYPLRSVTAPAGFRFLQSEVEAIDLDARAVRTADGVLDYDVVVVASGSMSNDFGIPGVAEHALPVKTLADAQRIRKRILGSFERAAVTTDEAERRALLTFVVIGAGPTGVEVSSSMRELMDHTLRPMHPGIDFTKDVSIVLIDGSDRPIQAMDPRLSALAAKRLVQQRISLVMRTLVGEIGPGVVRTKQGGLYLANTIVWSGGVKVTPLIEALDLPKSADGRLVVDPSFRAGGRDEVIAFGDAAYFVQDGRPLAQLAQVAVLQAPRVAGNAARALRGEVPVPYRHHPRGDLIALGRRQAGAQLGGRVFGGFAAWSVWRMNYLLQLLGVRHRATLVAEWTLSYFFSHMVADTP